MTTITQLRISEMFGDNALSDYARRRGLRSLLGRLPGKLTIEKIRSAISHLSETESLQSLRQKRLIKRVQKELTKTPSSLEWLDLATLPPRKKIELSAEHQTENRLLKSHAKNSNAIKHAIQIISRRLGAMKLILRKVKHDVELEFPKATSKLAGAILNENKPEVNGRLGAGGFGVVEKLDVGSFQFAQKSSRRRGNSLLKEEFNTLRLDHPNIISLVAITGNSRNPELIFELADTSLSKLLIAEKENFSAPQLKKLLLEISNGLKHLHDRNLVHRDIKPDNILIKDGVAKLGDLGSMTPFDNEDLHGTAQFMSPEAIRQSDVDGKTDVWSLGVMIYHILSQGKCPIEEAPMMTMYIVGGFDHPDKNKRVDFYTEVLREELQTVYAESMDPDGSLRDLMVNCLQGEKAKRFDIDQVISHTYFSEGE